MRPRLSRKPAHVRTNLQQLVSVLSLRIRSLEKLLISLDYLPTSFRSFASPILFLFARKSHPFCASNGRIVRNVKATVRSLSTKLTKRAWQVLYLASQVPPYLVQITGCQRGLSSPLNPPQNPRFTIQKAASKC